jgi:hypothetical protein
MPDGRWMEFWFKSHPAWLKWTVAKILDESGDPLVTLRWTLETRWWQDVFTSKAKPKFKRRGEAIIAPAQTLPTEPIVLVAYAFQLFDDFSTAPTSFGTG